MAVPAANGCKCKQAEEEAPEIIMLMDADAKPVQASVTSMQWQHGPMPTCENRWDVLYTKQPRPYLAYSGSMGIAHASLSMQV
jgi:hypothetical protein